MMPSERAPKWVDPRHLHDDPMSGMVAVDVRRSRSVRHNGMYWAQLGAIVKSGAVRFPTAEHLHDAIKLELGYVSFAYRMDGSTIAIPDSTAFDKMNQADFNAFYERAAALIAEHYGIDINNMEKAA